MSSKFIGFFYIVIFFVLLVPILFASAVGAPLFSSLQFNVFLLFCLVVILAILLSKYSRERKIARIIREEREESLKEGGIEEPHPFRPLTILEEHKLLQIHKSSKWIADRLIIILIIFGLIDAGFIYLQITYPYLEPFLVRIFSIIIFLEGVVIVIGLLEKERYLDLRSPVFKVQGRVIKEKIKTKGGYHYNITIRRIRFSVSNYPNIENFFSSTKDEEEVAVEYSPRTNHVWKIYKSEDLK